MDCWGKNDWLDIHHTVYLSNDSTTKLITSDKLLVDGLNAISPGRAISVSEFNANL